MPGTDLGRWFAEAKSEGWSDIASLVEAARTVHGEIAGFWWCAACDRPIVDPAIGTDATDESVAVILEGGDTLCCECYDGAIAARKKIVMHCVDDGVYDEDRSALTDDENKLACFLDRAEDAINRQRRDLINSYPRSERRQLHRYADADAAERLRQGKTAE